VTWKELTTIYQKKVYDSKSDAEKINTVYYKKFLLNKSDYKITTTLEEIEGKEVTIRGYFLDLGADAMWYMVSRFNYENCFFCTGVGIETVAELSEFQNINPKFKTDDIVTVTGTLYLVKENEEDYFYVLKNCSVAYSES
jgi:hypothetical protein